MQYSTPACHARPPHTGDTRGISTHTAQPDAQWIDTTASRRTGPRRWLRAVQWAIGAGIHPHATPTTMQLAEDLAARMDYDTGHVRYAIDLTITRTGLSRSTITKHAKVLRELGLLAWAQKGSRTNIRRLLGLKGYAGTATVYAATIPPCFDHAMGHRIHGTGYQARAIVDYRTMPQQGLADTATSTASGSTWTPSLTVVKEVEKVQVVDGFTTTAQARTARKTRPAHKKTTILGKPITGRMVHQARRIARWVRPLVNWLQGASHDQISWVLLDPIADGWDDQRILTWLASMRRLTYDGHVWRPAHPHRVVAAELRADHAAETEHREQEALEAAAVAPNADFCAAMEQVRAQQASDEGELLPSLEEQPATEEELWTVRELGRQDPDLVRAYIEWAGLDAAIRMYGRGLALSVHNARPSLELAAAF